MQTNLLDFFSRKCVKGNQGTPVADETVLFHALWKRWRTKRKPLYTKIGVKNIAELISKIISGELDRERFVEAVCQLIEPTEDDMREVKELKERGVEILTAFDGAFPRKLLTMKEINERVYPPLVIYKVGAIRNLNERRFAAIVGTRRCTEKGEELAREVALLLSRAGYVITTGLAKGIDLAATIAVVEEGGQTLAVRPWLDVLFEEPSYVPGELKEKILERGCVISENAFKFCSEAWIKSQFVLRNRIISTISEFVVVLEARKPGGSMYQVEFALRRGVPVYIWRPPEEYPEDFKRAFQDFKDKGAKGFVDIEELIEKLESDGFL